MKTVFIQIGKYSLMVLVLIFVFCLYVFAVGSSESPTEVTAVRSEREDNVAGLSDRIIVNISHLSTLQKSLDGKPLVLFINGLPLTDSPALSVDTLRGEVQFVLKRTEITKATWNLLIGKPKAFTKVVTVSVGLKDGTPIPCKENNLTFVVIRTWQFGIFFLSLLIFLFVIFLLYRKTDLLRGLPEQMPPVGKKVFSLALSQMLFWTVLVMGAYVFIWATTGDIDTVTDSILILMGISSATALGARVIDTTSTGTPVTPELSSGSFWKDILKGTTDYEPHRLQIVAWTLVLGIVFLCTVWADLTMPSFNGTLLTLMGISSGTYLGFKMKE
jgi:hypothetical protein